MSYGTLFKFFIAFISTAVYIRVIGTGGYAIIGIVFSLFRLISRFDIPYFLSFVKYNSYSLRGKKKLYERIFNTLYSSVLITNLLLFIFLFPLILFLSNRIYNNPDLLPFYIIAMFIFMLNRLNNFLKDFIRANGREIIIQKASVTSLTSEFVINMVLLLIFKFGVLSIFLGAFTATILEFSLLCHFTKKRQVTYRPYLSFNLFKKVFKEYAYQNYISKFLAGALIWGGLFLSTIYLDTTSLGVLTIFISLSTKLKEIFLPLWFHLTPVYSKLNKKKNYFNIKTLMENITFLLLILFIACMAFFLTIGEPIYSLYFGAQLKGTYFAFLLIISAQFFYYLFIPSSTYIFVTNIKFYNKINFVLMLIFFLHLFPLAKVYGLIGVVISYFVVYCLGAITFSLIFMKTCWKTIDEVEARIFIISLLSLVVTLFIINKGIVFEPILASVTFILLLFLVIIPHSRKISELSRYFIYEI